MGHQTHGLIPGNTEFLKGTMPGLICIGHFKASNSQLAGGTYVTAQYSANQSVLPSYALSAIQTLHSAWAMQNIQQQLDLNNRSLPQSEQNRVWAVVNKYSHKLYRVHTQNRPQFRWQGSYKFKDISSRFMINNENLLEKMEKWQRNSDLGSMSYPFWRAERRRNFGGKLQNAN